MLYNAIIPDKSSLNIIYVFAFSIEVQHLYFLESGCKKSKTFE